MSLLGIDGLDLDLLPESLINYIEDHPSEDCTPLIKDWLNELDDDYWAGRFIRRLIRQQQDDD